MQRSDNEWLYEFRAIMLAGYFSKGTAAEKLLEIEHADAKLRQALSQFRADILGTWQGPGALKTPGPKPCPETAKKV